MRRVLLWSSAVLLVLVAAGIGALLLVDLSSYRAVVEARAGAALGRPVTIAGDLEIKASLTPTLAATRVTIANVPGGSREDMARIGRLEIGLELRPLLGGTVRITHVAIVEADIVLEIGADGTGNWVFDPSTMVAEPSEASSDRGRRTDVPFIGRLELRDTSVSHTGVAGRTRRLDIEQAILATASEDDEIHIEIECVIDGQPLEASATTGSLSALFAGDADWPMQVALSVGESRISAVGTIADPTNFARYDLVVDADMVSADPIAILFGRAVPVLPAFSVQGSVAGDATEIRLSQISATLGGSDVGGDLVLSLAGNRPALTGDLTARRLDLADIPARISEDSVETDPDPAISVAALDAADLDLRFLVDKLVLPDLSVSDIQGVVRLDDRRLEIGIGQARLLDGALVADLTLDGRAQPAAARLVLEASHIDVGALLRDLQMTDAVTGHADAAVSLDFAGATRQAMIASADGRVTTDVGVGQINGRLAGLVGRSALTALLPIGEADTVELKCAVGNFNVSDGIATSTALLVDSQRATIAGEGVIDLGGRRLDLVFNPRSKDPNLLALVAPVRVHGPLEEPEVSVMTGDLVVDTAAGLLLGAINPIAIIIPFVTAGTGNDNPCLAALNDELELQSGSVPGRLLGDTVDAVGGVAEGAAGVVGGVAGGVGDAAAGVGGALGDVGRGIGNAIGGLFGGGDEPPTPADN